MYSVDFDTIGEAEDQTLRNTIIIGGRDTMHQHRIQIGQLDGLSYKKPSSKCSLSELKDQFLVLLKEQNSENSIQHEKQKLQVLLVVKAKLQNELPENSFMFHRKTDRIVNKSIAIQLLYWSLMVVGLLQQAVGSYLFATTLFSTIPGLLTVLLKGISIVYVLLDAIIFYAFNACFLKKALNLPQQSDNLDSLLKIYAEQLLITTELNQSLSSLLVLKMDKKQYEYYVELVVLMNQDLRRKNIKMQNYSDSSFNKVLKYGVIGFGLLSNIANSYYLGIAFSAAIAPVVGLFLSSVIIYLTIISGLSIYYAVGVTGIMRLANPNKESFDSLKMKLIEFSETYKNDLADVRAIRNEMSQIPRQISTSSTARLRLFDRQAQNSINENNYDEILSQESSSALH